jgi:hypothetical protein
MLFDLRRRGRRRTIQAVFLGMALLFLITYVGAGVGTGGSGGGLLNAFTGNNGSNSASFAGKVATAEQRTKRHPAEAAAWAALADAQLHQASEPEFYTAVGENEQYNAKGRELLARVSNSWNTYLRLNPRHASSELALKIARIYYPEALNQPAEEARALKVAIAGTPSNGGLYSSLAVAEYELRHLKEGDAATRKALSLITAPAERTRVKTYLAELRKNPLGHVPTVVSKLPNGTYVATQRGKTFPVKKTANGGFTGVVTNPAPPAPPGGAKTPGGATAPAPKTAPAGTTTAGSKTTPPAPASGPKKK